MSALFRLALTAGVKAAVVFHLKRGVELNLPDKKGNLPLGVAASLGYNEICKLLIESGADLQRPDAHGKRAEDYALDRGHTALYDILSLQRIELERDASTSQPPSMHLNTEDIESLLNEAIDELAHGDSSIINCASTDYFESTMRARVHLDVLPGDHLGVTKSLSNENLTDERSDAMDALSRHQIANPIDAATKKPIDRLERVITDASYRGRNTLPLISNPADLADFSTTHGESIKQQRTFISSDHGEGSERNTTNLSNEMSNVFTTRAYVKEVSVENTPSTSSAYISLNQPLQAQFSSASDSRARSTEQTSISSPDQAFRTLDHNGPNRLGDDFFFSSHERSSSMEQSEETLLEGFSQWEAEPDVVLRIHDQRVLLEAVKIHQDLSSSVHNDNPSWNVISVALPATLIEYKPLHRSIDFLIQSGLSLGLISRTQVDAVTRVVKLNREEKRRFLVLLGELGIGVDDNFYGVLASQLPPEPYHPRSWQAALPGADEAIEDFLRPAEALDTLHIRTAKTLRALSSGSEAAVWRRFDEDRAVLLRTLIALPPAFQMLAELVRPPRVENETPSEVSRLEDDEDVAADDTVVLTNVADGSQTQYDILATFAAILRDRRAMPDTKSIVSEVVGLKLPLASLVAKIVEQCLDLEDADFHSLKNALQKYEETRSSILKNNLSLVTFFARRYKTSGLAFMDLIQEGSIGLLRAVERFDTDRGVKFGGYAAMWIRQSISRAVADCSKTIRVPVHVQESIQKVASQKKTLRSEFGRKPSINELSESTGYSPEKVSALNALGRTVRYGIDNVLPLTSRQQLILACPEELPDDTISEKQLAQLIADELSAHLDPREVKVLTLRFGLGGKQEHTLEEVGQIYGVTRERIRQIEVKALKRLRHPALSARLKSAFLAHFKAGAQI
ncbi:RNA polymerase sigma factor (sigma-70 family) [Phyllobacterium trifolii]|uniref:RNA polymerase sigma factor n=1 Tax=Phyllobacterium trifolii TaxID=300193 RepID=A0A839ULM0_9HYPH|nr:sigma-70 family RNA polymerase sigma factor [Phyllobacterium trifolii]MBB3149770.1 RNA polymerase sigma factor (sigma-70 family) [Phyllobacterium trifolii]